MTDVAIIVDLLALEHVARVIKQRKSGLPTAPNSSMVIISCLRLEEVTFARLTDERMQWENEHCKFVKRRPEQCHTQHAHEKELQINVEHAYGSIEQVQAPLDM